MNSITWAVDEPVRIPVYHLRKILIRHDIHLPSGRTRMVGKLATLRRAIQSLEGNATFEWSENHNPYRAAEQLGVKITVKKLNGNGYVVGLSK